MLTRSRTMVTSEATGEIAGICDVTKAISNKSYWHLSKSAYRYSWFTLQTIKRAEGRKCCEKIKNGFYGL